MYYIWKPFGPVWTLLDQFKRKMTFCSKAHPPNPTLSLLGNKLILPEMVQKCPDGPNRVPNCQKKHLGLPFRSPLDHFGILTSPLCLAIFVYFIGAFFGMNATFNSFILSLDVRKNECNFHHLSFFYLPNCCWSALVQS